jgi:hypothetical protein
MNPTCSPSQHLSRRALMKGALATAAGGAVMNWGGLAGSSALAAEARKNKTHCILLWMNGGASQIETFDMKPGRPTGGPYRPVDSNVPGIRVCELMPHMAKQMDKVAVIRSMKTSEVDHPGGIYLMHTGYRPSANVRFPEMGAVVAKYQGTEGADIPDFVKVSSNGDAGGGFLGPKYQPFNIGSEGGLPTFSVSNMEAAKEAKRHELRAFVEDKYATETKSDVAKMHREAYEAARRLQKGREAFKIDAEWAKYKDQYGDSEFGKRCLLARKLVESGVAFVEVGQSSYDSHADNFQWHRGLVPPMEHAWAGLLADLKDRGLLDRTLIVWTGEIGRTPSINNRAGRDHFVRCWSTALAGCGIKGGQLYGASDENGVEVKENPVTEGDFFATIYKALGIKPTIENYAGLRPVPLAPFGSHVVEALLG